MLYSKEIQINSNTKINSIYGIMKKIYKTKNIDKNRNSRTEK